MDTRFKGVLILLVLAIGIYYNYPTYQAYKEGGNPQDIEKKVNLGLDLQGGMYLDIEVLVDEAVRAIPERTADELEGLMIDNQVDFLTVEYDATSVTFDLEEGEKIDLTAEPYDRFLVQFEEVRDGNNIKLTLLDEEVIRIKNDAITQVLEVLRNRIDQFGVNEPTIQRRGDNSIIIQLPGMTDREKAIELLGVTAKLEFYMVEDYATQNNYNKRTSILLYQEDLDPVSKKVVGRTPFILEKRPALSGEFVRDARVGFNQADNQPYVSLSFDSEGTDRFASITQRHKGRRMAIVLDNKVQSAPVIRETIRGGEASISGNFTVQTAGDLALVLRSGSLKAGIEIREERTVGASLGEDSVRQGMMSLLIGGVAVLMFMMFYYRTSGIFANAALLFNIVLLIGVLAFFGATLTLPGMAGIVLTIGMAVDANVLIFERIREELKRTGQARAAINQGFKKAFVTIFDANITTMFGAIALLMLGRGTIKGFALTLIIGIVASMFTAIVVTRFLFEVVYLNRKQLKDISI